MPTYGENNFKESNVNYLNKDFVALKQSLVNYAKALGLDCNASLLFRLILANESLTFAGDRLPTLFLTELVSLRLAALRDLWKSTTCA